MSNMDKWWLYLIACKGGGIYVGIAKNVAERFKVHLSGEGALYTKINRPLSMLAKVEVGTQKAALSIEKKVKKLSPYEKRVWVKLVESGADISELCSSFGFSNINDSSNGL